MLSPEVEYTPYLVGAEGGPGGDGEDGGQTQGPREDQPSDDQGPARGGLGGTGPYGR